MSREKLIEVAKSQVGYLEKKSNAQLDDFTANAGSSNFTKYGRDYDMWFPYKGFRLNGDAWCAGFVTWCFVTAFGKSVQGKIMPNFHYCPTGVNQFKNMKIWHTSNPQPGDVIIFKDTKGVACHTGIVVEVKGGRVYTVEGNTSGGSTLVANGGGVAMKNYSLGYERIMGYGRINYESGGLTVSQYNELNERLIKLEKPMIYNYIDDNTAKIAEDANEALCAARAKGVLKGNEKGELGLTFDQVRNFIWNYRAGLYR